MWKVSWIILIGFVLLFAFDVVSTLSTLDLFKYMETNPVWIKTGWVGLILMNFLALYVLLRGYDTSLIVNRYAAITSFVYLSVLRIFVIINNFSIGERVQSGKITKVMVESVSDSVKIEHYNQMIIFNLLAPIIFSMVIYYLFSLDHKIESDQL